MNHENLVKELEIVAEHNHKEVAKVDGDQGLAENIVELSFEEFAIYDPFVDETMRFEVNPIEYYGLENVIEMVEKFKKINKN